MNVGDLFVTLGLKKDAASFSQASSWIGSISRMALGLGAAFGIGGLGKAMFGFNSSLEDAKIQIATMMGISRKSSVASNFQEASRAVEDLRKLATKLPGTTEDYVNVLKQVSGPIISAKGSYQDLLDITVGTYNFSKMVRGGDWRTASREVYRAIEGTSRVTDITVKKMVEAAGMSWEQFRAIDKSNKHLREQVLLRGANSQQLKDYLKLQENTFSGQKEQLGDRIRNFLAKIGEGAMKSMTGGMKDINAWLEKNEKDVERIAIAIGEKLVAAFKAVGEVLKFLWEHSDQVKDVLTTIAIILGGAMLRNIILFASKWAPIYFTVFALYKLFTWLQDKIGTVGAAIVTAFAIGPLVMFIAGVRKAAAAMVGLNAASAGGAAAGGAGAAAGAGAGGAFAKGAAMRTVLPLAAIAYGANELDNSMDETMFNLDIGSYAEKVKKRLDTQKAYSDAMNARYGEMTAGGMYRDVQRVAAGENLGESFGRGGTATGPAVTIGNTTNTFNMITAQDAKSILSEIEADKQQMLRFAQQNGKK